MKQKTLCDAAPSDEDGSNIHISNNAKKLISDSHEPSTSTRNIPTESRRPMRPPPPVQIFPRPEIDLAGPSKTFPPHTTLDIIRLMTLQKDAEKDKKKRSVEDKPGCEMDNAIFNANKSDKAKKKTQRSRRTRLPAAKSKIKINSNRIQPAQAYYVPPRKLWAHAVTMRLHGDNCF
jgi:hypothetical protein